MDRVLLQSHSCISVDDGLGRPVYFSTLDPLDLFTSNKASKREGEVFQNLIGKKELLMTSFNLYVVNDVMDGWMRG